jgi:hypothetical protein
VPLQALLQYLQSIYFFFTVKTAMREKLISQDSAACLGICFLATRPTPCHPKDWVISYLIILIIQPIDAAIGVPFINPNQKVPSERCIINIYGLEQHTDLLSV